METEKTLCRRRERRFKTRSGHTLHCETLVNEELHPGTVIDISPSGLRMLCQGRFSVGEEFTAELKTNRSHGSYKGIVRRVEPWVGGQSVIGCQLTEKIPTEVLETLARENVVDRRNDGRIEWKQTGHMTLELQSGEVDVTIRDCSPGGLKMVSKTPVPDDTRVRIRLTPQGFDEVVIDARSVWQIEDEGEFIIGVAFTKRQLPEAIARVLEENDPDRVALAKAARRKTIRRSLIVAASLTIFGFGLLHTGTLDVLQKINYDELLTRLQVFTQGFGRD